jgi:uncharacterized protein (TIGR02453 family)
MRALLEELAPVFDAEPVVFRPYRDVRFGKDKPPYKTHQGGFLEVAPGIGYWIQLDVDGVLVGGGFHAHSRDQTARWRTAVYQDETGVRLETILRRLTAYEVGGDQVRTRPRGVPTDHPRLDLMRREFLTVARRVPADTVTTATVRTQWTGLRPLLAWIHAHVGGDP